MKSSPNRAATCVSHTQQITPVCNSIVVSPRPRVGAPSDCPGETARPPAVAAGRGGPSAA